MHHCLEASKPLSPQRSEGGALPLLFSPHASGCGKATPCLTASQASACTHTHTLSLYDSLCALGKRYARYEERTRIDKWKSKTDQAWLDRPKKVYQWILNEYQPPVVMLLDPDTSQQTANIPRMDEILHTSWDQVMRKYADTPEPDVHVFAQKYDKVLIKGVQMQSTPITGFRLAKRLRRMGVHTATGLDGWCVSDLLLLPNLSAGHAVRNSVSS